MEGSANRAHDDCMSHVVDQSAIKRFLSGHRFAVVGASDDPKNFGRTVVTELTSHGFEVVAVNPNATEVAGVPSYPDVASVRGELDGVVIMVPAPSAAGVVEACAARGLRRVWLFRGAGGVGSVSDDAIEVARLHDLDVIVGACPLMFLEPVGWFHRMHRAVRRRRGQLVAVVG